MLAVCVGRVIRNSAVQYIVAVLAGILAAVLMLDVVGLSAALFWAVLPGPVILSLLLLPQGYRSGTQ